MSYGTAIHVFAEPVRSLAYTSISGTYMGIGTGFSNPCLLIFLQNQTDAPMMFSFDGVHDHLVIPAFQSQVFDISNNKTHQACFIKETNRVYVKEILSPSTGSVYVTTFYGVST